jgi:hypothetical protein
MHAEFWWRIFLKNLKMDVGRDVAITDGRLV